MVLVMMVMFAGKVWAQEAYAMLKDSTLTLYYDKHKPYGLAYENFGLFTSDYHQGDDYSKVLDRGAVAKLVFDKSFSDYKPSFCQGWFYGFKNLREIVDMDKYLNTENVKSMYCMFSGCRSLTSLDLSSFNTGNVTNMAGMVQYCSNLTNLNLSSFNTANVTTMESMFFECDKLTNLDFSNFNTSNVTNMSNMFYKCNNLTELDLRSFNTAKVINMRYMFAYCENLNTIAVGPAWSTIAVQSKAYWPTENYWPNSYSGGYGMFSNCGKLVGEHGNKNNGGDYYDIKNANVNNGLLSSTPRIAYITLKDGNASYFFDGNKPKDACLLDDLEQIISDIKSITIDKSFANYSVTSFENLFRGASNLTQINGIENLNFTHVRSLSNMFNGCSSLASLDLSSFNTQQITSMFDMFNGCKNLTTIYIGKGWSTDNISLSDDMFAGCNKLVGSKGTMFHENWSNNVFLAHVDCGTDNPGYLSSKTDDLTYDSKIAYCVETYVYPNKDNLTLTIYYDGDAYKYVKGGKNIEGEVVIQDVFPIERFFKWPSYYNIITFDISFKEYELTSCESMFWRCGSKLKEIVGLENLNTANVYDMSGMFSGCSELTTIDLSNLNTENVTDMSYMFSGCSNLTSLDLSGLNTARVTDMSSMFSGCASLTSLDLSGLNTENVRGMSSMFSGCSNLTSLDLSNFSFSQEYHIGLSSMFCGCSNIQQLDLSNFNVQVGTDLSSLFEGCKKLKKVDLSEFKMDGETKYMDNMFKNCDNLTTVVFPVFNLRNCRSMKYMFQGCKRLEKLDLSTFGFSTNSPSMTSMFADCINLKEIDLSSFTRISDYLDSMFYNCKSLKELDLTSFDNNMKYASANSMFENCSSLSCVLVKQNWISPKKQLNMFKNTNQLSGCVLNKLTNINEIKGYATLNNNGVLQFHISCTAIPTSAYPLDTEIPGWSDKALKIEKVVFPKYFKYVRPTSLYGWFFNCRNLTEIEGLEYLNTEDVENMSLMFAGCKNLVSLDLSNFNTQNVTSMKGMFGYYDKDEDKGYYCDKLETIFVGDGWTTKYTEDDKLFEGCKKLVGGLGSTYNEKNVSTDYAHIDGGKSSPGYLTYMPDEAHKTVAAIAMNALPKTEYIQGEPLSTTGGTIKVDYNNMTTDIIDLSNAEITGFDTEKVGNQVLVVTYYDKKTTYEINVKAKTITKLEVTTMPKTEYGIGEKINLDGGVLTVSYSNNLSEKVALSQAKVSGYDPMKLGTQKLSVIYLQNETSFEVKVVEKPAKSIAVTTLPKVLYVEDDAFTAEGGIITITYDGGSKGESNLTNAKLSGFEPNKIGEQTIKVEYLGCETSYKVTVKELAYYNVTYKIDGEIYGEVERVKLGSAIIPREAPAKDGYTFSGWSEIPANMPDHDIEIVGSFTKDATPEDPTTPTSEISINSNVKIWSFDRTIVIENPGHDIQIVDINGRLVKTMKTDDSRIEIPMSAPGIYIVKTVAKTQKVMLK